MMFWALFKKKVLKKKNGLLQARKMAVFLSLPFPFLSLSLSFHKPKQKERREKRRERIYVQNK